MPVSYDATADLLDRNLVFNFFWKFSVFECALKREGFLARKRKAEPDWKRFGESIAGRFGEVRAVDFQESIVTLVAASPRQQVTHNGQLEWKNLERRADQSEEGFVLDLVRTARNNLFHGGKYPDGPVAEVARDKAILRAALTILEGCYELHQGVARWVKEAV